MHLSSEQICNFMYLPSRVEDTLAPQFTNGCYPGFRFLIAFCCKKVSFGARCDREGDQMTMRRWRR